MIQFLRKGCSVGLFVVAALVMVTSPAQARQVDDPVFTLKAKVVKDKGQWIARIQVLSKGPYHCNLEYPWKVKVKAVKGASVAKEQFKKPDAKVFTGDEVRFDIPLESVSNGSVQLEVKFSMCDDKQCFMKKVPLTLAFSPAK